MSNVRSWGRFSQFYQPDKVEECQRTVTPGSLWQHIVKNSDEMVGDWKTNIWVPIKPDTIVMILHVAWSKRNFNEKDVRWCLNLTIMHGEKIYEKIDYDCNVWLERFKRVM